MLTPPHECPWLDLPTAARTITSVMSTTNPLIAYVYNSPKPLSQVPWGKSQLMSIYLGQLRCRGYVLSIDDGDNRCVGVAVWTGPKLETEGDRGVWRRWGEWIRMVGLGVWIFGASIWYRGAGMDGKVLRLRVYGLIC